MLDNIKLSIAVLLLGGAIAAFYYYEEQSTLFRVLGLVAVAAISLAVTFQTAVGRKVWGIVGEARTEMRKVVWPTGKETTQTTLIVVVMVIVVGIFLWVLDMGLLWAVRFLTEQGV
jgi:preprotein translocase subunit SecE